MEAAYNKQEVRQLDSLPDEEKTEDIGYDLPEEVWDGVDYSGYPVVDMGWWFNNFYIHYDTEPEKPGEFDIDEGYDTYRYEELRWISWAEDDGTLVVDTSSCAGIMDHETAELSHSPGAEAIYPVYNAMLDAGIKLVVDDD